MTKSRVASGNTWEIEFQTRHIVAKPTRVATRPKAKPPTRKIATDSEFIKGSKVNTQGEVVITRGKSEIRIQLPDTDGLRPHEIRIFNAMDDKLLEEAGRGGLKIRLVNADDLGVGRTGFKAQANADPTGSVVNLARGNLTEEQYRHTLIHELGHIIDKKVGAKLGDDVSRAVQGTFAQDATLTTDVRTAVTHMMENWDDLPYDLRSAYSYPRTMWIESNNNINFTAQEAWAESVSYWYTKPDVIQQLPSGLKDILTTAMEGLGS